MTAPAAAVKVSLDKAQAERDAESFSTALAESFGIVTDRTDQLSGAADLLRSALGSAWEVMRDGVAAAAEDAAAEARLEQALRARGLAVDGVVDKLNNYNQVMMQSTGIADDQLLALQTQLVALGVQADKLDDATAAAVGLSEISGKGLVQSATAVARVLEGQLTPLTRLGVEVRSVSEAMEFLSSRSTLAGSQLGTSAGQWNLLAENLMQVRDALGDPIARSDGVIGSLVGLNEITLGAKATVEGLTESVSWAAGGDGLGFLGAVVLETARGAFPTLITSGEAAIDMFRNLGREALESAKHQQEADKIRDLLSENAGKTGANWDFASGTHKAKGGSFVDYLLSTRVEGATISTIADKEFRAAMASIDSQLAAEDAKHQREAEAKRREEMRLWREGLFQYSKYDDGFVGPLDPDTENFREADASAQVVNEIAKARQESLTRIEVDGNEARFSTLVADYERRKATSEAFNAWQFEQEFKANEARQASLRAHIDQGLTLATGFAGTMAVSLGSAAKQGKDASEVAEQAFGGVVIAVGQSLVALGTAGLSAALLGTAAPWLFGVTGGAAGVVASLASIGVGTAMLAGGGYLTATTPAPSAPAKQARQSPRTEADVQTFGDRSREPVSSTFIIRIDGGIWGMDTPRALRDLMESDGRLVPVRPGGRW